MSEKSASRWPANKGVARGILHNRTLRRRVMGRFLLLLIAVFAIGLWVIEEWLRQDIWRFFLWWAGCGALAVFIVMFAIYDVFAVLREERGKPHR
jgi:peptidoglycan biosynthesis protein MviN/MurJ (putative lipid II flippase)